MQLVNKISYPAMMEKVHILFCNTFGEDIVLIKRMEAFEHMGHFELKYSYLPLEYELSFENECDTFGIEIYDNERAKNSLYRIIEFNNELEIKNIECAIQLLKSILERGGFCFYLIREGKIYVKENQQYRRVRDITELMKDIEDRKEKIISNIK